jgi:hypothetical protein
LHQQRHVLFQPWQALKNLQCCLAGRAPLQQRQGLTLRITGTLSSPRRNPAPLLFKPRPGKGHGAVMTRAGPQVQPRSTPSHNVGHGDVAESASPALLQASRAARHAGLLVVTDGAGIEVAQVTARP